MTRASVQRPLVLDRLSVSLALVAAIIAALGLSACGRNGGLELPPGPATSQPTAAAAPDVSASGTPQDTGAKTGFDAYGNPVAPPGQKKPFFLDPLLR
jgi:predicted small lipoprotein YifL